MSRFVSLLLILFFVGCNHSKQLSLPSKLFLPESLELYSFDYDGRFDGLDGNLKIIASYDSIMCGVCSVNRLIAWRDMIEFVESTDDVSLLFIFSPKIEDSEEVLDLIKENPVDYPIFYDVNNNFAHSNDLPRGLFICLLDRNDSIIFSGNPFFGDTWDQYKNIISNYRLQ